MGELNSRFFIAEKGTGELKIMQNTSQKENVMEYIKKDWDMEDRMRRSSIYIYSEGAIRKNEEKAILEDSMVGNFKK